MPHSTPTPTSPVLAEIAAGLGISLSEAARRLPSHRRGRPVHSSCVWRWISRGVTLPTGELVFLQAAKLSGRWLTTGPALQRFLAAQTPPVGGEAQPAPRTPAARQRASERAAKELEKIGI